VWSIVIRTCPPWEAHGAGVPWPPAAPGLAGPSSSGIGSAVGTGPRPEPLEDAGRAGSLDGLVGPKQHRLGNREPERPGGLEVDHQLGLGGLLDG
jgi:hypothetical protein